MNDYTISFRSSYRVGYHLEKDEIFLFTFDGDGLFTVFVKGKLDAMFFEEFMSNTPWFELGEL